MPSLPTELQSFILGLIWQLGPVSPYEVRRHMQDSPSTQWSASAGAIYPLMRRLERGGLVKGTSERRGNRRRREYRITRKGLAALRCWIGPPVAAEAITVAHDPLRSRARFLAALTPRQRLAWIGAARLALDEVERKVLAWQTRYGPKTGAAAAVLTRSGALDVASRRQWVSELARAPRARP